jgi:hypothetical protein
VTTASLSTRFAHKPSCPHTRARLLRVGDLLLCRGCTLLWTGVALGAVVAIAGWAGAVTGFALLAVGLAGLRAPWYAAFPNAGRDISRFALGAGPVPVAFGSWRAGHWFAGTVALWCVGVLLVVAMRARLSRPAHRCDASGAHGS